MINLQTDFGEGGNHSETVDSSGQGPDFKQASVITVIVLSLKALSAIGTLISSFATVIVKRL